jgi:hypothetical protein
MAVFFLTGFFQRTASDDEIGVSLFPGPHVGTPVEIHGHDLHFHYSEGGPAVDVHSVVVPG